MTNPRPPRDSQQPFNNSSPLDSYPGGPTSRDTGGGFQSSPRASQPFRLGERPPNRITLTLVQRLVSTTAARASSVTPFSSKSAREKIAPTT
jgi:hypothetical protein